MLPLSSSVLFTYSAPLVCVHSRGVCLKLLHCRTGVPCLGFSAVKSLVWQVAWARSECRKSQPHPSPSQPQMCLSALPFLGSRGCLASAHDVPVSSSLVTFRRWTVQFMLLIPPPLLAPLLWRLLLGWEDQCLVQRSSCCQMVGAQHQVVAWSLRQGLTLYFHVVSNSLTYLCRLPQNCIHCVFPPGSPFLQAVLLGLESVKGDQFRESLNIISQQPLQSVPEASVFRNSRRGTDTRFLVY